MAVEPGQGLADLCLLGYELIKAVAASVQVFFELIIVGSAHFGIDLAFQAAFHTPYPP